MQTLTDFIAYFRLLAAQHVAVNSFVHGSSERIVSQSRSELEYPCLWLETPSMRLSDNRADVQGHRESAFIVFQNAPAADHAAQDRIWNDMEAIVLDIIARIRKDAPQMVFRIDLNSVQIEPINTIFVDGDYGWRTEFRTDKSVPVCHRPEKWTNP